MIQETRRTEEGTAEERQAFRPQTMAQPQKPVIIVGEPEQDKRRSNSLSVCSLVLGIMSVVFFFAPHVTLITGIVAVVQGIVAVAQHRAGQGLAVAGIVTGGIGFLLALFVFLVVIFLA